MTQASEEGLDGAEVKRRLDQYGYNKLPESTRIPFLVFLGYLWNPLSWAMEVAAILAIILLDYADFALIVALLLVNATIRSVLLLALAMTMLHAPKNLAELECPMQ